LDYRPRALDEIKVIGGTGAFPGPPRNQIMKATLVFPACLVIIDLSAAAVYALHGQYAKTGYWIMAAGITFFATIM